MSICITKYNCICNIGRNIDEVYKNALSGISDKFEYKQDVIKNKTLCIGVVDDNDVVIDNEDYNLKCNRLLVECIYPIKNYIDSLIIKHGKNRIGIVVATTNTGVNEFEQTQKEIHSQIGNSAMFLREYLGLESYYTGVSTACTSGIKAFSIARDLIKSGFNDAVIVAGTDTLSNVPLFGFSALEVLSGEKTNPLSKNRSGINIGEGTAVFVVEKSNKGIEIMGIGETTDTYHSTSPDPDAVEAIRAIKIALDDAQIAQDKVDYINLHGTGSIANDITETKAISQIFDKTYVSATKPLTGHCLGAAACVETALCCALIEKGGYYKHIYDGEYDVSLPNLNIYNPPKRTNICMNNAFGFGGTNAIMIIGRQD